MPIPDYQSLMLPVLQIASKGPTRVPNVADEIAQLLSLSKEEVEEMLPSGKQRLLHNRIHWAKFYMAKAGLVSSPKRGVFVASPAGISLLESNPRRIDVELLKTIPSFSDFYFKAPSDNHLDHTIAGIGLNASESTPEEQIDSAFSLINSALEAELLQRVMDQTPHFFERLIVDLLVAMGYGGSHDYAARQLGKSGDGGVDGVIDEDRLGLDRIYVQAKRYASGVVGRPEIQGFVGRLVGLGANKGVFVTTSSFSKQAQDYANGLQQRVVLIDGSKLSQLMIEFKVGVRVNRLYEVKKLDEDFFLDDI